MKAKVIVFYAISALSISLFVASSATDSNSFEKLLPNFQIGSVLLESADHMVNVRY